MGASPIKAKKSTPKKKKNSKSSAIGDFVRRKRNERDLTQKELASYSEVSFTLVNRVENGDIKVQLQTLNKILNIFGYEVGPTLLHSAETK
jgi:transcriptional regulator with XRE-family HTH domain